MLENPGEATFAGADETTVAGADETRVLPPRTARLLLVGMITLETAGAEAMIWLGEMEVV